ncbi:MAG: acyl-CoA thioesterase [Candidatus Calescibacterium sp.]|nr:acyl-CoA thioesterase [Candidatus Calescibacterium sp.]
MDNVIQKITKTDIYVRYYETDRMKIVHHSNYFRYYELARCDFFIQKVIPYSVLEEKYFIMSPLLSAYSEFYRPLRFEDVFSVVTFVYDFSDAKIVFGYLGLYQVNTIDDCGNLILEYLNNGMRKLNRLVCFGKTEHTFVDSKNFKPVRGKVFIEEKGDTLCNLIRGMRL